MAGRIASGHRAGECRSCGRHDPTSAPESCTRCAFETAVLGRRAPAYDRQAMRRGLWRRDWTVDLSHAAELLQSGKVPGERYLVWIDPGDARIRPLHGGDNVQGAYAHDTVAEAERVARACAATFPSAWVVTADGVWRVR